MEVEDRKGAPGGGEGLAVKLHMDDWISATNSDQREEKKEEKKNKKKSKVGDQGSESTGKELAKSEEEVYSWR